MTDPTQLAPEAPHKDPFVITVTLDGYLALEARVAELEARTPAGELLDAELEAPAPDLAGRLDRHRAELDELKRRYNQLVEFLELPTAAASTPGGFL